MLINAKVNRQSSHEEAIIREKAVASNSNEPESLAGGRWLIIRSKRRRSFRGIEKKLKQPTGYYLIPPRLNFINWQI
jgi:hypothetical protein